MRLVQFLFSFLYFLLDPILSGKFEFSSNASPWVSIAFANFPRTHDDIFLFMFLLVSRYGVKFCIGAVDFGTYCG